MDPDDDDFPIRPDHPIATALAAFSEATEGWAKALSDLNRFFTPLVARTPALQEDLKPIYQQLLAPWRARVDELTGRIEPYLIGKRQTQRRMQVQRHVREQYARMQAAAEVALTEVFPAAAPEWDVLVPVPGSTAAIRSLLQG